MELEPKNEENFLSIDEVKYLGIDYDDEVSKKNIERYIKVALKYLKGAIDNLSLNDERVKQLALFVIEDLYDRNSYSVKENTTLIKLKNNLILQLQYEDKNG